MPKVSEAPAPPAQVFKMPAVALGQVVLWTYGPDGRDPCPAVVLSVGGRTVNLAVHVDGIKDHVLKTGVRHKDDPFLQTSPEHDSGVWDLTVRDRRIDAMLANLGVTFDEE